MSNEAMQWELFNNFSKFDMVADLAGELDRETITSDFVNIAKDYMLDEETQKQIAMYREISNEWQCMPDEIAYWRKCHYLHDYMCETFKCENTVEVTLTKDAMVQVLRFAQSNAKKHKDDYTVKQLTSIIMNWDSNKTYSYYAWW